MLQTDKLHLRACEPDDLPLMYQWENNADYWLLSDTTKPFSNYTIAEFIKQDQNDIFTTKQQRFVIELRNPVKPIGEILSSQLDLLTSTNLNPFTGVQV